MFDFSLVADLVFPWFIFLMGTSMAISLNSFERRNAKFTEVAWKICRRSVILFALGMFINNGHYLYHWRILGVLQRFGVSYLVVGFATYYIPSKKTKDTGFLSELVDVAPYLFQWCFFVGLLAIYLAITFLLDVPGCGRGV